MGLLDWLSGNSNGSDPAAQAAAARRHAEILMALQRSEVPPSTRHRLKQAQQGQAPWIATLSPAELLLMRSHGIKPIATVSATASAGYS